MFYLHYLYISPLVFFIRLYYNLSVYFGLVCNCSVLSVVSVKMKIKKKKKKKEVKIIKESIFIFNQKTSFVANNVHHLLVPNIYITTCCFQCFVSNDWHNIEPESISLDQVIMWNSDGPSDEHFDFYK